ncbi:hypothetical protein, partial [Serratia liquefaciens]|uniref:hypothetical protein n=1 Tax=Serratia liquefaciens TaxID=614 RepID=UPI001A91E4F4
CLRLGYARTNAGSSVKENAMTSFAVHIPELWLVVCVTKICAGQMLFHVLARYSRKKNAAIEITFFVLG